MGKATKRRSSEALEESGGESGLKRRSVDPQDKENTENDEDGVISETNAEDVDVEEAENIEEGAEEDDEEGEDAEEAKDVAADNVNAYKDSFRRKRINKEGKPPEAGVIKKIYMENFMCHRKLGVDLCRNVNFIHGQNGSGKSAVLAAIQICLGAGARRTNRARNLKDLVRKEAASGNAPAQAKIRVTLLNEGDDGYKHEIYGDTITVERTISLNGGYNGYKLLNHEGKEKSRCKKDLDEMLDVLNIQVENPVAVLDQEEAKKFLTGKAEDKYNFFMKATDLERVDRTFAATVDHVQDLRDSQEKIKDTLQLNANQVEDLKKKWEAHQALDKLEDKVSELKVKLAWALFTTVDKEYTHSADSMSAFQEKAAKYQQQLSQAEEAASAPSDDEQAKRDRSVQLVSEAQEQTALKRNLEAELKQIMLPSKTLERQLHNLRRQQATASNELVQAKQRLQDQRDQILAQSGSAESEEARRTASLQKAEEELEQARAKVNELRQTVSTALRSYEELEPHVTDAKAKVEQVSRQLHTAKSTISALENSSNDSLAILGPRVSKVHEMVEAEKNQGRFKGPVVGPIGAFIKVVQGKEDFANIAEVAIGGGTLDRFIVTNDHDRKVLQSIRTRVGCRQDCGIFQVHETPRFKVPPPPVDGIETVASVLNIPNDIVFNCLVDNARIDSRALARDKTSSEQKLLTRDGRGEIAIRGIIKEVYCMPSGDKWIVKGGSMAAISNDRNLRSTIGADRTAAIAEAKREAAQYQHEVKEMRTMEAKLEGDHTKFQRHWNQAKRAMQQNDATISGLVSKVDEIKLEMESTANITIDTTEFEEDVAQAENAVGSLKESESQLSEQISAYAPEIKELQNRLDETVVRNSRIMEDMEAAEANLATFLETQTQKKGQIDKKRKKVEQYQQTIAMHQEKCDKLSAERDITLETARKLHYRMMLRMKVAEEEEEGSQKVDLSVEATQEEIESVEPVHVKNETGYYQSRIDRMKEKIKEERQRRKVSKEDPSVAYEKYIRAKRDLAGKVKRDNEIDSKVAELSQDMKNRKRRWRQFRTHLDRKTGIKFDEMLSLNKYAGTLDFNHQDATLDLCVQKDNANSETQTKDVKALSGGERSYTTMCLLLALGESLETPFRILDEFDVFLDAQVRKLTIEALIHVAKKMNHRQFIFITPQDLSSLTPDPQLKILRLTPPTRHTTAGGVSQTTLPFQASQQGSD